jgi:hypothetical protein
VFTAWLQTLDLILIMLLEKLSQNYTHFIKLGKYTLLLKKFFSFNVKYVNLRLSFYIKGFKVSEDEFLVTKFVVAMSLGVSFR